ncbi:MAG: sulfotransferase, partial [Woeseia sp.]
DAAAEIYRRLYDQDASNSDACYGLGTVLMQQFKFSQAAELLSAAVDLNPEVPEFVYNYSTALEQLGKNQEAATGYLRAAELSVKDPELLATICHKLIDSGMADAASRYLSACGATTVPVLKARAKAQAAMADWGGAYLTLLQLTKLEPGDAMAWRHLASAAGRRRDYAAAIDAYKRYMELKTPDADDLVAYADLLFLAKRPEESKDALANAMQQGAENAAVDLLAAKTARLDGDYESARKHLRQAIEQRPAFGDAWQLLLESESSETLPQFAAECARLATSDQATVRDRIVLALTAGRAFEKLDQYTEAFEQFRAGNELQKAEIVAKGLRYDTVEIDSFAERVVTECDTPFGGVSPSDTAAQPVFILGMPRSGTTLVERILGGLDDVVVGGESESMEFIATQYYWDLERGRVPPPRDLTTKYWDALAAEYWRRSMTSACRLTDKMPHNFWHVGFICAMFPGTPIIYMRRDPRDVCLSIYSRMFAEGHRYACDLESLAHYYAVSVQIMEHWKSLYPNRILEVVYEELVSNPGEQTQAIAAFCGLPWDPACLDFHTRVEASFTFSEMQVRQPLNKEGIGAWRRYQEQLEPLTSRLESTGILASE